MPYICLNARQEGATRYILRANMNEHDSVGFSGARPIDTNWVSGPAQDKLLRQDSVVCMSVESAELAKHGPFSLVWGKLAVTRHREASSPNVCDVHLTDVR